MENTTINTPLIHEERTQQRRAEDRMRGVTLEKIVVSIENMDAKSPEAMQQIVHQLQVHQIELEMQNEELRRTQLELEAARLRYFDLYDLAPVGYCTLSEHDMILEANLMAAKMFDCSRGDLVNKTISSFIFKSDQDIYYLHRKRLVESGEPQSYELRIINNSGAPMWIHLNATYEKNADGIPQLRKVMTDISERKQAERTLRESEERYHKEQHRLDQILQNSNIELKNATAIAEKANLAKSDFLSNMSHELRTPLSAILGFAQLIESGSPAPTPKQQRNVDQILQAGWYLLDLINEILDLALIESGKLSMSLKPVGLEQVLRDCQTMIEPQAQQHNIRVIFTETEIPYVLYADSTRLKQVLINLMSNAIKYNKTNGTVIVSCTQSSGRVRISVKDSGEGLVPEQIAQLFQPFNRLGQENKAKAGTGIGLVMTKHLIELMNGEIGLESTVGKGSTFWVEIELIPEAKATNIMPESIHDSSKILPLDYRKSPHIVLYVEDNPANLILVEEVLEHRLDIELLTVKDGTSGIRVAREKQPHVILMDINLPGMSGISALKILQEDSLTAHIPVIALSANAIPADIKKGLDAGFFRYLTKPFKINEFIATIDLALTFVIENNPNNIN